MLLVIFGAGASYDSVLHLPPPPPEFIAATNKIRVGRFGTQEEFRLPLLGGQSKPANEGHFKTGQRE
jgi:hypothetical protein